MPPIRGAKPKPKALTCPACGSRVDLRYPQRAISVVCESCGSILDTSSPQVSLIQQYKERRRIEPKIPLGARKEFRGETSEVIGFVRRKGTSDGFTFEWDEYLLYNPFTGYRFLAETMYGWTLTHMTNGIPRPPRDCMQGVEFEGQRYRYTESYDAIVTYVLGEFYWAVEIGESVRCLDFTASKPHLLMAEQMEEEYIWSVGEWIPVDEIWTVFGLTVAQPSYSSPDDDGGGGVTTGGSSKGCGVVFVIVFILVVLVIISMASCGGCSGGTGGRSYGGGFSGGK